MRASSSVASSPCRSIRCEALRGAVVARGPGQPRGEESLAKVSYTCGRRASKEEEAMMDRERPSASDSEDKIPEAWIGQEVINDRDHRDPLERSACLCPRLPGGRQR